MTVGPADSSYENLRTGSVWQSITPPRYPARIERVTTAEQAAQVITRAAADGLKISIVSGGHSYVANGLQDGTVLLDLSALDELEVDVGSSRATMGPGVRNGTLERALAPHGLTFPIGHSPTVAVGGYLLGGGLGFNSEALGAAACFNVVAADVILASGDQIRVSEAEHPTLFWALRGAGPFFCAAVTAFHVQLSVRAFAVVELTASFPLSSAISIAEAIARALPEKSPRVELSLMMHTSGRSEPDAICTVSAIAFADSGEAAAEMLAPISDRLPDALTKSVEQRALHELLARNDAPPARYAVETAWTNDIVTTVESCAEQYLKRASDETIVHLTFRSEPTVSADAAFSITDTVLMFSSAVWQSAEDDAANRAWSDALIDNLRPLTSGFYVNETEYLRHPSRLGACFSPEAWRRIEEVRDQYDPHRLFWSPPTDGSHSEATAR